MEPFRIVSRYFWFIAIVVTGINVLVFMLRAKRYIKENPQLKEGYVALFRGYLLWLNIPWVVMGIGCTIGGVPSVWHYFRPRDGNPYVLAWFGSVFLLWVLGTFWLFDRGGAETLASHPGAIELKTGFRHTDIANPTTIKIVWLLALAGGVAGVAFMWIMDVPIPNFK
jgi:hypothetical protein